MKSLWSVCLPCVVGAAMAMSSAAHAQREASLEGVVGYYRPLGHYDPASVYVVGMPHQPSDLQGPLLGVSGQLRVSGRFGVAAQVATASSRSSMVITPEGPVGPASASVVLGTLVGQFDVATNPGRFHLRLSAGPAFVRHGGEAYKSVGSSTSFAPAVGTSLVVPIWSHLRLSAGATGLFYTTNISMPSALRGNAGQLQRGRQRDLLLQVGAAWTSRSR